MRSLGYNIDAIQYVYEHDLVPGRWCFDQCLFWVVAAVLSIERGNPYVIR